MATWGLAAAKARFSEVVEKAIKEGPQEISRSGRAVVVLVSKEEWIRSGDAISKESLGAFMLRTAPKGFGDVSFPRSSGKARAAKL